MSFTSNFLGGQSNFSLGWSDDAQQPQPKKQQQQSSSPWATDDSAQQQQPAKARVSQSPWATDEEVKQPTSVKVHHAPGGQSSISFGDSGSTDERFKTSSQQANQGVQQPTGA